MNAPSIFQVNYNQVGANLLPPQWRQNKFLAVVYSLYSAIQWLRDWFYDWFCYTNTPIYFENGSSTIGNKGDKIRFIDNSLWECEVNNCHLNLDNPIYGTLYNPAHWTKLQNDFVGLMERVTYNSQTDLMQYIVNKYFNPKGYVNPTPANNPLSNNPYGVGSIYSVNNISDANPIYFTFSLPMSGAWIGDVTNTTNPQIGDKNNLIQGFPTGDRTLPYPGNYFTVNVLTQIATDLGANYESIIRSIIDKYLFTSIQYEVVFY